MFHFGIEGHLVGLERGLPAMTEGGQVATGTDNDRKKLAKLEMRSEQSPIKICNYQLPFDRGLCLEILLHLKIDQTNL